MGLADNGAPRILSHTGINAVLGIKVVRVNNRVS